MIFRDRAHAGRALARKLKEYADRDTVVLGLARGGVPVAYEVAMSLDAPLDVFVARKLGVPAHEEYAMGAIAEGGVCVMNDDIVAELRIPQEVVDDVRQTQVRELERRVALYREGRDPLPVQSRTAILVDDGLATGASMRAAVISLRARAPRSIVVAVPIAAESTCDEIGMVADRTVCLIAPESLGAVSMFYDDFSQTNDHEVGRLLEIAASRPPWTWPSGVHADGRR